MNRPILKTEHLRISLRNADRMLVNDIGFELETGGNLTILGQSGSGKTLTCRSVLGLLNKQIFRVDGQIWYEDTDLQRLREKERKRFYGNQIAFVPQNPMTALDPSRKIGHQMIQFLLGHQTASKSDFRKMYASALKETGLTEAERVMNSLPGQLSGGMLQRILIALAIAGNAKLVIADEPTTALDAIHRDQAVEQLIRLQEHGCSILLVTHDFDVACQMGGNVLIMKDGQMVEQGAALQVLKHPKASYTQELISAAHLKSGR